MRKLTKIVAPALIAALGAGTLAIPAQAQAYGRHDAGHATPVRNSDIRADINGLTPTSTAL